MWYVSFREKESGEKGERRVGERMDKGALHGAKKAHVESETDKVTQSRVALTERESGSVPVITVFTFPFAPSYLFIGATVFSVFL